MTGTVLITGSSSGYGEATAKLFASRGWNVVATMRNPADGKELAALKNVLVNRLDVQDQKSIDRAITEGIDRFGRIDAVVNNAGYGLLTVFERRAARGHSEELRGQCIWRDGRDARHPAALPSPSLRHDHQYEYGRGCGRCRW